MGQHEPLPAPTVEGLDLTLSLETSSPVSFERAMQVSVRQARLLTERPWVRSLGRLGMKVSSEGWRFPTPPEEADKETRRPGDKEKGRASGDCDPPSPCLPLSLSPCLRI